eukprot:7005840-Lingulodinium_polyedra.AAC.1
MEVTFGSTALVRSAPMMLQRGDADDGGVILTAVVWSTLKVTTTWGSRSRMFLPAARRAAAP